MKKRPLFEAAETIESEIAQRLGDHYNKSSLLCQFGIIYVLTSLLEEHEETVVANPELNKWVKRHMVAVQDRIRNKRGESPL